MNKKLSIPAALIATALVSSSVFAHGWERDDWHEHKHRHHRWVEARPVQTVYVQPQAVYAAPPVVYRERVVYQLAPVYYERPVTYRSYSSDRIVGQAIGAVAGGVIGSQFGHGRVIPTAIGAVVGGVVGGNLLGY